MATRAGAGYSEIPASYDAGVEAARAAVAEAGVDACDLTIMYSTSKHDPVQLRDGARSVIGPGARLFGGSSIGAITKDRLGYDGYQVGVAVLSSDSVKVDMFIEGGLPDNEYNVGVALGQQIRSKEYTGTPSILLMYDSVKGKSSDGMVAFQLNLATPLIEGMGQSLGTWPQAAGAGMAGDLASSPTYQWFDDRIEQQSAMALVFSGSAQLDTTIMHGCKPASGYHTITKVDDFTVLEIDGKPALEVVAEMLGPDSYRSWEDYPFFMTLGVNKGDKFGEFREEDYANHVPTRVDKDRGGLVMIDNHLKEGFEVQFMRRDLHNFDYVTMRAQELLERVEDRKPFLAFYIDCFGRTSVFAGTEGEEAEEVQKIIGSRMPLLGMYSSAEIAKVGGDMQGFNYTGVLCVFSE